MPLTFYPHSDDAQKGSVPERIDVLMEAAERFRAIVMEVAPSAPDAEKRRTVPRDLPAAFNWEEISRVMREIRDLPENTKEEKIKKAQLLIKLAEVYEVLRAAKMSKLEAVRLALISEANHLSGGSSSQVA